MVSDPRTLLERSAKLRRKSGELRERAMESRDPVIHLGILKLADQYDQMAEQLENIARAFP
jgi:hypothetical protein